MEDLEPCFEEDHWEICELNFSFRSILIRLLTFHSACSLPATRLLLRRYRPRTMVRTMDQTILVTELAPTQEQILRMLGLRSLSPTQHLPARMGRAWQHPPTLPRRILVYLLWPGHLIFAPSCRLPASRSTPYQHPSRIPRLLVSNRVSTGSLPQSTSRLGGNLTV